MSKILVSEIDPINLSFTTFLKNGFYKRMNTIDGGLWKMDYKS